MVIGQGGYKWSQARGVISGQKLFGAEKMFLECISRECFILDIRTLFSLFTKNNRKVLLLLKVNVFIIIKKILGGF